MKGKHIELPKGSYVDINDVIEKYDHSPIAEMQSVVEKIMIERVKKVDSVILGEIQQIAVENGLETKIILNEPTIRNALEKQIPQKAKISLHGSTDWNTKCRCPSCNKDLFDSQKYCSECGQRIDWGDKK